MRRILNQEPLGPVAATQRFGGCDEVVARADRLPYGLAASAWTQPARTMAAIGDAVEAGMIGIKLMQLTGPETPCGGSEDSGEGSDGGTEDLEAYLLHKYIAQG